MGSLAQETEVAVIGAGPGGYVAALRLADLGKDVMLIDERARPGGTCLLEGCIPSKTLIHAATLADTAREADKMGLHFDVSFDIDRLRSWTESVVDGLSQGISGLLEKRGVEVVKGRARFTGKGQLAIEGGEIGAVSFRQAIIATGSRVTQLPLAADKGVWTSTEALTLPSIPPRLIVVGGGYIGLELGMVYAGLGARVKVVEFLPQLLTGADPDLTKVMLDRARQRLDSIMVESKVTAIDKSSAGFVVDVEAAGGESSTIEAEQVLVAVGRTPNTDKLGLETIGLEVDAEGRIVTDEQCRTKIPDIYAIGDVTHGPMLAHKATREAKVAAEVIAGFKSAFDNRAIPAVVFTDPEIAWAGLTESEAKAMKIEHRVGRFPLRALGRARSLGRTEGLVKVIIDDDDLVIGVGMVGPHAGEMIAEGSLAIEMGATLEDLMITIHPHPTLSEALMEAAEVAAGTAVHLPPSKPQRAPRAAG